MIANSICVDIIRFFKRSILEKKLELTRNEKDILVQELEILRRKRYSCNMRKGNECPQHRIRRRTFSGMCFRLMISVTSQVAAMQKLIIPAVCELLIICVLAL